MPPIEFGRPGRGGGKGVQALLVPFSIRLAKQQVHDDNSRMFRPEIRPDIMRGVGRVAKTRVPFVAVPIRGLQLFGGDISA